jgi:hypothetical protein
MKHADCEHFTPPMHALLPQVTEHGWPAGHITWPPQLPVLEQSKWQRPPSHAPPPAVQTCGSHAKIAPASSPASVFCPESFPLGPPSIVAGAPSPLEGELPSAFAAFASPLASLPPALASSCAVL